MNEHNLPLVVDEEEPQPIPLRDLDFTDIYIAESGEAFLRGLMGEDDPLYEIPDGAVADLETVHMRVCSLGREDQEFTLDHDNVRYRVSRIDNDGATWYALRRSLWPIPRLKKLEIHPMVVRQLGRIGKAPSRGLILIAGATGNGKTTTMCSLLQEYLIQYGDVAVTIEDPPELRMEGKHGNFGRCFQNRVVNGDFAGPLRLALRMHPRYLMLGEIRDPNAAVEALHAANSGHVVLATIHGGSIEEALVAVQKLVASKLDPDLARTLLAGGLAAVLHQQLFRIRTTDNRVKRTIKIRSLFIGDDAGLRAKIRDGKTALLGTDIEMQASRIARNESPLGTKPDRS